MSFKTNKHSLRTPAAGWIAEKRQPVIGRPKMQLLFGGRMARDCEEARTAQGSEESGTYTTKTDIPLMKDSLIQIKNNPKDCG